jgi:hypothetical protein
MLLFITRATQYANSSLFIAKMVIVVAGSVNALALHLAMPVPQLHGDDAFVAVRHS